MRFFITLDGRKLKHRFIFIGIAFFTALFFYSQSTFHIPVLQEVNTTSKAIYKGEKGIALTFNISWGEVQAKPILDLLEKNKVRAATFFVSGAWAEKNPDTIEHIQKLGYEIGSLGYAYEDYTELDENKVRQDILKGIESLQKLDIKEIRYIRSPTGHFDERTLKIASQLGVTLIHWSINSDDWKNPGTEVIIEKVNKAKDGDIVLLHASDSATQTEKALPSIIEENKNKFVSLESLISNGKVKTKTID